MVMLRVVLVRIDRSSGSALQTPSTSLRRTCISHFHARRQKKCRTFTKRPLLPVEKTTAFQDLVPIMATHTSRHSFMTLMVIISKQFFVDKWIDENALLLQYAFTVRGE